MAGGHSIDTPEPIYGLAVTAPAAARRLRRNADAKAGDVLILTKPVGVGVYSAAIKREALSADGYRDFVATTTLLNKVGTDLAADPAVHALTDVTGFGILGHGLELARGAGPHPRARYGQLRCSPSRRGGADGFVTGASHRNWTAFGSHVDLPADLPDWRRHLLTDPQTSGGLLVSCEADSAHAILDRIRAAGYPAASIIGRMEEGAPRIRVTA